MDKSAIIHIGFNIDDGYAKYMAVCIRSILASADDGDRFHFHVLTTGVSERNVAKINRMKADRDFDIDYVKMSPDYLNKIKQPVNLYLNAVTVLRLAAADILGGLDKLIFMDVDLVVLGGLRGLWDTELGDNYGAYVRDVSVGTPHDGWIRALNLKDGFEYINSGVGLMNLKKWRDDGIAEKIYAANAEYRDKLQFPEQDLINVVCAPKLLHLPVKYNVGGGSSNDGKEMEDAIKNPIVRHWVNWQKPWKFPDADDSEIFFKFARSTEFYEEIIYANIRKLAQDDIYAATNDSGRRKYRKKVMKYKILQALTFGAVGCFRRKKNHYKRMLER